VLREKSSIPLLTEIVQSARAIRAGPSFVFTNFILAVRAGHNIFGQPITTSLTVGMR